MIHNIVCCLFAMRFTMYCRVYCNIFSTHMGYWFMLFFVDFLVATYVSHFILFPSRCKQITFDFLNFNFKHNASDYGNSKLFSVQFKERCSKKQRKKLSQIQWQIENGTIQNKINFWRSEKQKNDQLELKCLKRTQINTSMS